MKYIYIFILMSMLILLISACGRGDINDHEEEILDNGELAVGGEVIASTETTRVLTVETTFNFVNVLNAAAEALNADWNERGYPYIFEIDFKFNPLETIEIDFERPMIGGTMFGRPVYIVDGVSLTPEEAREMHANRLGMEFMTGMASDLIFNTFHHPVYRFAGGGHLADFYTLIDNCPVTSRDDFFMNVLKAYELFGDVYALPLMFAPSLYVGINTNLQQHFVDRFAELSYIKTSDLMRMYLEILDEQDAIISHGVWELERQISLFLLNIGYFVDYGARTANFIQPELTELLELLTEFSQRSVINSRYTLMEFPVIAPAGTIRANARSHIFHTFGDSLGLSALFVANAFFNRDIVFDHFIPLADDNGRVILSPSSIGYWFQFRASNYDVWIPAGRNADLAWEFTRHLIEAVSRSTSLNGLQQRTVYEGINSFRLPIKRTLFDQHMRRLLDRGDIRRALADYYTDEEFAIAREAAIARIYEISNMPMTLPDPMFPSRFITEPLEEYSLGLITATEALNRMQNAVRLWLIE